MFHGNYIVNIAEIGARMIRGDGFGILTYMLQKDQEKVSQKLQRDINLGRVSPIAIIAQKGGGANTPKYYGLILT